MKNTISLAILLSFTIVSAVAQSNSPEGVVRSFFRAMYETDTTAIKRLLHEDLHLGTTSILEQVGEYTKGSRKGLISALGKSKPGELDEHISKVQIFEEDALATVVMDYAFYYKGAFSHCGINHFTLVKERLDWKILSIVDTRRKDNCYVHDARLAIDKALTDWHDAASAADSTAYFDAMTDQSVFVGTDRGEVWSKAEFVRFSAPYFQKGKAWEFKAKERNIYSDDYNTTAYFDEVLDTWMGHCRGSGVMIKQDGQWKIQHYVLSLTVPNDDIKGVIELIGGK